MTCSAQGQAPRVAAGCQVTSIVTAATKGRSAEAPAQAASRRSQRLRACAASATTRTEPRARVTTPGRRSRRPGHREAAQDRQGRQRDEGGGAPRPRAPGARQGHSTSASARPVEGAEGQERIRAAVGPRRRQPQEGGGPDDAAPGDEGRRHRPLGIRLPPRHRPGPCDDRGTGMGRRDLQPRHGDGGEREDHEERARLSAPPRPAQTRVAPPKATQRVSPDTQPQRRTASMASPLRPRRPK